MESLTARVLLAWSHRDAEWNFKKKPKTKNERRKVCEDESSYVLYRLCSHRRRVWKLPSTHLEAMDIGICHGRLEPFCGSIILGSEAFEIWLLVRKPSVDEPSNLNLCLWNVGWLEPFDQKVVCRILFNYDVSTIDILQSTMASHIVARMFLRVISLKQSALMAQSRHLRWIGLKRSRQQCSQQMTFGDTIWAEGFEVERHLQLPLVGCLSTAPIGKLHSFSLDAFCRFGEWSDWQIEWTLAFSWDPCVCSDGTVFAMWSIRLHVCMSLKLRCDIIQFLYSNRCHQRIGFLNLFERSILDFGVDVIVNLVVWAEVWITLTRFEGPTVGVVNTSVALMEPFFVKFWKQHLIFKESNATLWRTSLKHLNVLFWTEISIWMCQSFQFDLCLVTVVPQICTIVSEN